MDECREWPYTETTDDTAAAKFNCSAFANVDISLLPRSQRSKLYYDLGMYLYITFMLPGLDPFRNFHLALNILLLYPAICWHQKYGLNSLQEFFIKEKKKKKKAQTSF